MRLPFTTSRKAPEPTTATDPAQRTGDEESHSDQAMGGAGSGDEGASDRSTKSMPLDTPATSYSSTTSANDRQGKKSGVYELSGNYWRCFKGALGE